VIAGLIGFFFAWFYIRSPKIAKKLAASLAATYKLLSGKYFVDELYAGRNCPAPRLDFRQGSVAR